MYCVFNISYCSTYVGFPEFPWFQFQELSFSSLRSGSPNSKQKGNVTLDFSWKGNAFVLNFYEGMKRLEKIYQEIQQ